MNWAVLAEYGVDYKTGLARCLNDSELYSSLLTMFLQDTSYANAKEAFEKGDDANLFLYAHELKGACGNAGLTPLYEVVSELVNAIRAGSASRDETKRLLGNVDEQYYSMREAILLTLRGDMA